MRKLSERRIHSIRTLSCGVDPVSRSIRVSTYSCRHFPYPLQAKGEKLSLQSVERNVGNRIRIHIFSFTGEILQLLLRCLSHSRSQEAAADDANAKIRVCALSVAPPRDSSQPPLILFYFATSLNPFFYFIFISSISHYQYIFDRCRRFL